MNKTCVRYNLDSSGQDCREHDGKENERHLRITDIAPSFTPGEKTFKSISEKQLN